jgi:hypothetical protein
MLGKGKIQYKETVVGTRRLQYIYKMIMWEEDAGQG